MRRMTRSDIKLVSAHLDIPYGDPNRFGEKRDFVADVVGGVVDAVGSVVDSALPVLSSVAAAIPGPWQIPALVYNTVNAIDKGNIIGAASGMLGLSGVSGVTDATSWFDAPVDIATANEAWANLPADAQQAYLNAGYDYYDVGKALAQDQMYTQAFNSLPEAAQASYIQAGYNPSEIGSQLLSTQSQATAAFDALPQASKDAYLAAGYTPEEIGSNLLADAAVQAGGGANTLGLLKNIKSLTGGGTATGSSAGSTTAGMLGGAANTLGGILQGLAGKDAATQTAAAQIEAARLGAEAAKFKPVGVTTRFGTSNFVKDANGNLIGAGYNLSPDVRAQQDKLMTLSGGMLDQYALGQTAALPMGQAGQTAMSLGQGYLSTDPAAQAAKYMAEQQALLAPTRERELVNLENRLRAQGRLGLATGATESGLAAANPELEAFYNAKRMQDLQLAAQATQGGMDYAKFGAGMVGTGGDLLKGMYGTQSAAYQPYQTALGGAQTLEGLGQQAMTQGMSMGSSATAANAAAGGLLAQGMNQAAQTMQPANAYSPWASLLAGAGNTLNSMNQPTQTGGMLNYDPAKYRLTPI